MMSDQPFDIGDRVVWLAHPLLSGVGVVRHVGETKVRVEWEVGGRTSTSRYIPWIELDRVERFLASLAYEAFSAEDYAALLKTSQPAT